MAGRMAGPIKTKLGIGTHVDPGSVLVKVKVIWHHLVNANKTPYRGLQGPREFEFRPEDGYLQSVAYMVALISLSLNVSQTPAYTRLNTE